MARKRKLSAYTRHMKKCLKGKKGKASFKKCAHSWKKGKHKHHHKKRR